MTSSPFAVEAVTTALAGARLLLLCSLRLLGSAALNLFNPRLSISLAAGSRMWRGTAANLAVFLRIAPAETDSAILANQRGVLWF